MGRNFAALSNGLLESAPRGTSANLVLGMEPRMVSAVSKKHSMSRLACSVTCQRIALCRAALLVKAIGKGNNFNSLNGVVNPLDVQRQEGRDCRERNMISNGSRRSRLPQLQRISASHSRQGEPGAADYLGIRINGLPSRCVRTQTVSPASAVSVPEV